MNEKEKENAFLASPALRTWYDSVVELFDDFGNEPEESSIAAQELGQFQILKSVDTPHLQGSLLLFQAADHLGAFIELTSDKATHSLAPSANARSVVENSALACWLLNPNTPIHERVARSLAMSCADMRQQKRTSVAWDKNCDVTPFDQRIEDLAALSVDPEIDRLRNVRENLNGIDLRMPSFTEIVKQELGYEKDYRFLSSLTHGNITPVKLFGYQVVGAQASEDGVDIASGVSPRLTVYMSQVVAGAFSRGVESKVQLFGWNHQRFIRDLEPIHQTLNSITMG